MPISHCLMISGKGNDELLFRDPHFKYQNNWTKERSSLPTAVSHPPSLQPRALAKGFSTMEGFTLLVRPGSSWERGWETAGNWKMSPCYWTSFMPPAGSFMSCAVLWCSQQGLVTCAKSWSQDLTQPFLGLSSVKHLIFSFVPFWRPSKPNLKSKVSAAALTLFWLALHSLSQTPNMGLWGLLSPSFCFIPLCMSQHSHTSLTLKNPAYLKPTFSALSHQAHLSTKMWPKPLAMWSSTLTLGQGSPNTHPQLQ